MSYTAENFIEFIEWGRSDKISSNGLKLVAKKFREQQQQLKELNNHCVNKQSELLDFISWYANKFEMRFTDDFKNKLVNEFKNKS